VAASFGGSKNFNELEQELLNEQERGESAHQQQSQQTSQTTGKIFLGSEQDQEEEMQKKEEEQPKVVTDFATLPQSEVVKEQIRTRANSKSHFKRMISASSKSKKALVELKKSKQTKDYTEIYNSNLMMELQRSLVNFD